MRAASKVLIHAKASFVTLILLCGAFGAAQDKSLRISISPVFEGFHGSGMTPYALFVQNNGANTSANLEVPSSGGSMSYPFSLPAGSKKRVVFYVDRSNMYSGSNSLVLRTERSFVPLRMPEEPYGEGSQVIAMVSDTPGLLGFLQTQKEDQRNSSALRLQPNYVRPEDAPDRLVGYDSLTAVVLGEGAERLSDSQIEALKRWVITGGTLIFVGGANTSILNDQRWSPILPLHNVKSVMVPSLDTLRSYSGGESPAGSVAIVVGEKTDDATTVDQGDKPIILTRTVGMGSVTLFAFDPFIGTMESFSGRARLVTRFANVSSRSAARRLFAANGLDEEPDNYTPYATYSGPSGAPYPYRNQDQSNPFKVDTPEATSIIWLLVAYFAVVVPINFIVLRLLKKGEWAWLTAPVISIAFAAVFFQFASGLYRSDQATNTSGTLVFDSKMPYGVFVGSTQIFFPKGGGYDLGLKNIDSIRDGGLYDEEHYYYGYQDRTNSLEAMQPVDTGEILAPNMRSSNLGFYQVSYAQMFDGGCPLVVTAVNGAALSIRGGRVKLKNNSKYKLFDVTLAGLKLMSKDIISSLGPGESTIVELKPPSQNAVNDASQKWYVSAILKDEVRPGPIVGREVNPQPVKLIVSPELQGVRMR